MSRSTLGGPAGGLVFLNAGTLYREHQPCVALADLVARRATFFDLGEDGRAKRAEAVGLR